METGGTMTLQWGRVRLNAEITEPIAVGASDAVLQWGRALLNAEMLDKTPRMNP